MKSFRPQEVKMINKVLREKSHCVVCRSNKSKFLKQKLIINIMYKNKMKTYCVKCKKDTENIDPKIEQKIIDWLCDQNILFVELKNQDL